jgi:NADPH:quinone reductase-like Zn-dependent oxidoreductase
VVAPEHGGPEVLVVEERPDPVPAADQAVVRLRAATVNPIDLAARTGWHPPGFVIDGPPYVPGWDLAGEVVAVGSGVDAVAPGDRVVAMIPWHAAGGRYGAYAESVLVEAHWLVPLPEGADPVEAATLPLNGLTAVQALAMAGAGEGDDLLITGASGAVGGFAVQLAAQAGVRVTASASRGDEAWVRDLGATTVLSGDELPAGTGPFRHVLDAAPVGEAVFGAVAPGGTVVATGGVPEAPPELGIGQQLVLVAQDTAALAALLAQLAAGTLRTRIARTVPLEDAAEAHRLAERRGRRGKIVLVA